VSRFEKLAHVIWYCQYHLVWVPKYRHRILEGEVQAEIERCIRFFCDQKKVHVIELNIRPDHVHLLAKMPPKVSVLDMMGILKGRTAIRIFKQFPKLESPIGVIIFGLRVTALTPLGLMQR